MSIQQKIKMALAYIGRTEAWLAREIGTTPQAFNQRMKTGKFSSSELDKIAAAMGADFKVFFVFKDGTEV